MKTLHIATTVLSAALISGLATAQDAPGPQCERGDGPRSFQRQRGPQGGPGGRQGQRGGQQQGFRGQRGGPGMGGPGGGRQRGPSPEALKEAGATDEQIAQLKKVKDEQELAQVDLKAKAEKAQIELKQLMGSDKPDKDAVFAAIDKVSAARAAMMKNGIAAKLKAREIIGEEVAAKLKELCREKGKGQRGQRGPRGSEGEKGPRGRAELAGPPPVDAEV